MATIGVRGLTFISVIIISLVVLNNIDSVTQIMLEILMRPSY